MSENKAKKQITFITPSLQRTGSEIALVNLLKHVSPLFSAKLISKYKGVLFDKALSGMEKKYFNNKVPTSGYYSRIRARVNIKLNYARVLSEEKNSTFYINTIILPDVLAFAERNKIKTIVHLHELEQMYAQLSLQQIKRLVTYPYLIIANSHASANVIRQFGRTKPVEICYPSLETSKIKRDDEKYFRFRKELNIPEDSFLWVMSGTLDANKNPFLFIEIASEILKTKTNVMFMWIGGTINISFENACKGRAAEHQVSDKIIWAGNVGDEYSDYFNCADGFVLTSEKESFSLVTVEALLHELPIVTQDCGGVREILKDDIGKIVKEKNNASLMANEMICFMNGIYKVDKEKQILRAKEFDVSVILKHWNEILEKYC